jgi:hypothetical protein
VNKKRGSNELPSCQNEIVQRDGRLIKPDGGEINSPIEDDSPGLRAPVVASGTSSLPVPE